MERENPVTVISIRESRVVPQSQVQPTFTFLFFVKIYTTQKTAAVIKTKLPKTNTEQALLKNSLLIYENGECQLYQLD